MSANNNKINTCDTPKTKNNKQMTPTCSEDSSGKDNNINKRKRRGSTTKKTTGNHRKTSLKRQTSSDQAKNKAKASNALKRYNSDQNVARIVQQYDAKGGDSIPADTDYTRPKRSRSLSMCRITGMSKSFDEPHYFPSKNDFPYFGRRSSCHITLGHVIDEHHFPVFDPKMRKEDMQVDVQNPTLLTCKVDVKKVKRPSLKSDSDENPMQLLKERFRQKNQLIGDDNASGGGRKNQNIAKTVDNINSNTKTNHNNNHSNICNDTKSDKNSISNNSIVTINIKDENNNNVEITEVDEKMLSKVLTLR